MNLDHGDLFFISMAPACWDATRDAAEVRTVGVQPTRTMGSMRLYSRRARTPQAISAVVTTRASTWPGTAGCLAMRKSSAAPAG